MKTKTVGHTPGPWREQKDVKNFKHIAGSIDDYGIYAGLSPICQMAGHWNSKADAALIAAAPELLEACKYALNWINDGCPKFDEIHTRIMIEAAIAKAEGK